MLTSPNLRLLLREQIDEFHTTSIARLHADIARLPDGWSRERGSDVKWNSTVIYRSPNGRICRSVLQAVHIARLELSEDAAEAGSAIEHGGDKRGRALGSATVTTPSDAATASPALPSDAARLNEIVHELVEVAETVSPEWLPLIVRKLVGAEMAARRKGSSSSSSPVKVADTKIMETCRGMVKMLVEAAHERELLVREGGLDAGSSGGGGGGGGGVPARVSGKKRGRVDHKKQQHLKKLRMIFAILARFCAVSTTLLLPYISEFTMYLDPDDVLGTSHDETVIVFHFIKIVGLCAARLNAAPHVSAKLSTEIIAKLQRLIFTSATRELVVASIDALCRICHARRQAAPMFNIMTKFYRFLNTNRANTRDTRACRDIRRSLVGLGYFSLHGNLRQKMKAAAQAKAQQRGSLTASLSAKEMDEPTAIAAAATGRLTLENVVPAVYDILTFYALEFDSPSEFGVQQDAIEGLVAFFSAAPGYIIRPTSALSISKGLHSRDATMRAATLRFLATMLDLEEQRVSGNGERRIDEVGVATGSDRSNNAAAGGDFSGASDTDHHCFTDGLRSHTHTVHQLLLDGDPRVKLAALQLQSLLLRQGLVDPSRSVAIFIAMQCDSTLDVANGSLKLLRDANAGLGGPSVVKGGNINAHCLHGIAMAFQCQAFRQPVGDCSGLLANVVGDCFATFSRKPTRAPSGSRTRSSAPRTRGDDRNVKQCYSFLGPLYACALRTNDRRRHEFFEICVSAFKHTESLLFLTATKKRRAVGKKKAKAKARRVADIKASFAPSLRPLYLRFLTATLALLPFELEEEVISLVMVVNQVGSTHVVAYRCERI